MTIKCVLFYPFDILGKRIGGAETFLRGILKFAPSNFEIDVIGTSSDLQLRPLYKWTKIQLGDKHFNFLPLVYEKDENKKSAIPLSFTYTLQLALQRVDTKNKVLFFNRIEPAVLYGKPDNKCIVVIHNDIERQVSGRHGSEVHWNKIPILYHWFEGYVFKKMDHVYSVSQNSVSYYQRKYVQLRDLVSFLPTWVDTEIFNRHNENIIDMRGILLARYPQIPIKSDIILFVGRLQEQKAPLKLIDALKAYLPVNKNAFLIIIGDGNLRQEVLEYTRRCGLADRILMIKFVDQLELSFFYKVSDVLLLTSNYEGMPVCVLEALACGLPVVSTNVGELSNMVKSDYSGEIVGSFDVQEIVRSLSKVLSNGKQFYSSNCVKSIEKFTPKTVLAPLYEKITEFYETLNEKDLK